MIPQGKDEMVRKNLVNLVDLNKHCVLILESNSSVYRTKCLESKMCKFEEE